MFVREGTWCFLAHYSVSKIQLALFAHLQSCRWKNTFVRKFPILCVKQHYSEGACCLAHTGTFCLSLLKRIVLDTLGAERLWALRESLQTSERTVLQRTLCFISLISQYCGLICIHCDSLASATHRNAVLCVWFEGLVAIFWYIYYLF